MTDSIDILCLRMSGRNHGQLVGFLLLMAGLPAHEAKVVVAACL